MSCPNQVPDNQVFDNLILCYSFSQLTNFLVIVINLTIGSHLILNDWWLMKWKAEFKQVLSLINFYLHFCHNLFPLNLINKLNLYLTLLDHGTATILELQHKIPYFLQVHFKVDAKWFRIAKE